MFMMIFELLHHIATLKCKQVMGQNHVCAANCLYLALHFQRTGWV